MGEGLAQIWRVTSDEERESVLGAIVGLIPVIQCALLPYNLFINIIDMFV